MEIVIEYSLIVSILVSFLILKTTAFLVGRSRLIFLSSLLSSGISLVVPLYKMPSYLKVAVLLLVSVLIVLIVFKYISFKNFLLCLGLFYLSSFIYGGGCFALRQCIGQFPLFVVAIVCIALYIIYRVIYKIILHRSKVNNFVYKLKIKDGGKSFEEEGYLDSGNVLYDDITKSPIVLVNFNVFSKLYKDIPYITARTQKLDSSSIKNGHYIKINSVGRGTSILVFTVDELQVGEERSYKNAMLGLSFSGFEKSFGKNILLHCDYS